MFPHLKINDQNLHDDWVAMLSDDDNDDTMPMALFSAPKFFFLVFFSTGSQRD
jgi:hypothetical protein